MSAAPQVWNCPECAKREGLCADHRQPLADSLARVQSKARTATPAPDRQPVPLTDILRDRWAALVPTRYQRASIGHCTGAGAAELAEWAQSTDPANLLVLGPCGVGKTYAAVAACRAQYPRVRDFHFAAVGEMLDRLRPGGDEHHLSRLLRVGLLMMDDLGSERVTDWSADRIYLILNRRWMEGLPTVVTSNLPVDDLEAQLGPRAFSRLVGSGALVLRLAGQDRRRSTT